MPNRAVTWEDVESFKSFCTARVGVIFVKKADLPGAQIIRMALDLLKAVNVVALPSGTEFMDNDCTDVGIFILLGVLGSPQQALCSIVHELQHAINFERDPVSAVGLYIAEPEARATYEAGAYLAGSEARFELDNTVDDPVWVKSVLAAQYAIDAKAVDLGVDLYTQGMSGALSGAKTTAAGKLFAEWLGTLPSDGPSAPSAR